MARDQARDRPRHFERHSLSQRASKRATTIHNFAVNTVVYTPSPQVWSASRHTRCEGRRFHRTNQIKHQMQRTQSHLAHTPCKLHAQDEAAEYGTACLLFQRCPAVHFPTPAPSTAGGICPSMSQERVVTHQVEAAHQVEAVLADDRSIVTPLFTRQLCPASGKNAPRSAR
jgi:hypothetical protein